MTRFHANSTTGDVGPAGLRKGDAPLVKLFTETRAERLKKLLLLL